MFHFIRKIVIKLNKAIEKLVFKDNKVRKTIIQYNKILFGA
jgi:hypothetical protein